MVLEERTVTDPRIVNLARIVVEYSLEVRPGHTVEIGCVPYVPRALPYVEEIYRAVLRAGGHPLLDIEPEGLDVLLLREGNDDQLKYIDPRTMLMARESDRSVVLMCEENTRRTSTIDPARQALRHASWREYHQITNQRTADGSYRWVLTNVPTNGYAQDADMDLASFEDFYFKTIYADQADPITPWIDIRVQQEKLVSWLHGKEMVEVKGPNVDLRLSIKGRPFISCHGDSNLPDGEIFTAPVEDSVDGWVRFTYPAIFQGREVSDVELTFEAGSVVKATASKNEAFLHTVLDMDPGARRLGEFAIGTNHAITSFTKNITFDEKIGGTIHMALGFGYPESGSKNESALHWDMICDMKEGGKILIDGQLFYDSGEFKA
jgi:aminopeptidase